MTCDGSTIDSHAPFTITDQGCAIKACPLRYPIEPIFGATRLTTPLVGRRVPVDQKSEACIAPNIFWKRERSTKAPCCPRWLETTLRIIDDVHGMVAQRIGMRIWIKLKLTEEQMNASNQPISQHMREIIVQHHYYIFSILWILRGNLKCMRQVNICDTEKLLQIVSEVVCDLVTLRDDPREDHRFHCLPGIGIGLGL